MSAQSTIAKLRKAIEEARAQNASDETIIATLAETLTVEQLTTLLGEADPGVGGAILKALYPAAAPEPVGKSVSTKSPLTVGAGTFKFEAPVEPIAKSRKAQDADAHADVIEKRRRKIHKDIFGVEG
jgi:hypothetical protein